MLNRDEIKKRSIIAENAASDGDQSWRATSYDVRVGKIIAVDSDGALRLSETESHTVPAQGMVEVISLERLQVPHDVAGYASIKTALSREGLLALNTGIIDPSYQGPVSAVMVNFSKIPLVVSRGDPFLRLTFHQYDPPANFQPLPPIGPEEFLRGRRKEAAVRFSTLFLNLPDHIAEAFRTAFRKNLPVISVSVALLALFLGIVTWLVSLEVSYSQPYSMSKDQVRATVNEYFQSDDFRSLKSELAAVRKEELHEEVRLAVDQALANSQTKAASSAAQGAAEKPKRPILHGVEHK